MTPRPVHHSITSTEILGAVRAGLAEQVLPSVSDEPSRHYVSILDGLLAEVMTRLTSCQPVTTLARLDEPLIRLLDDIGLILAAAPVKVGEARSQVKGVRPGHSTTDRPLEAIVQIQRRCCLEGASDIDFESRARIHAAIRSYVLTEVDLGGDR